jgi:hypothetical protein
VQIKSVVFVVILAFISDNVFSSEVRRFFLEVRYENGANNGDHRSTTHTLNREQLAVSWRTSAD